MQVIQAILPKMIFWATQGQLQMLFHTLVLKTQQADGLLLDQRFNQVKVHQKRGTVVY